jgi:hypothetical protein
MPLSMATLRPTSDSATDSGGMKESEELGALGEIWCNEWERAGLRSPIDGVWGVLFCSLGRDVAVPSKWTAPDGIRPTQRMPTSHGCVFSAAADLRIVSRLCYIPNRLDAVRLKHFLQERASLNSSANYFQYWYLSFPPSTSQSDHRQSKYLPDQLS